MKMDFSLKALSRIPPAAAIFAGLVLLWSCSTVPYTGRSQFMMTSVSEENSLGDQAWREILSKERVSNDAFYSNVLKECGTYIARVADRPDFKWEFRVLENPEVNAFCLPGGKVAVYTGLFKACTNEAELSAVVGHEVGHAIARHGGERMTQQLVQQIGAEALKVGLGGASKTEAWLTAYAGISSLGVILPYSRVHEYEADKIGMILMAKAGYDPNAALSFWEKMASKEGSLSSLTEFLSTHPMSSNRIEEMKKVLPEAMEYYRKAPVRRGTGRPFSR